MSTTTRSGGRHVFLPLAGRRAAARWATSCSATSPVGSGRARLRRRARQPPSATGEYAPAGPVTEIADLPEALGRGRGRASAKSRRAASIVVTARRFPLGVGSVGGRHAAVRDYGPPLNAGSASPARRCGSSCPTQSAAVRAQDPGRGAARDRRRGDEVRPGRDQRRGLAAGARRRPARRRRAPRPTGRWTSRRSARPAAADDRGPARPRGHDDPRGPAEASARAASLPLDLRRRAGRALGCASSTRPHPRGVRAGASLYLALERRQAVAARPALRARWRRRRATMPRGRLEIRLGRQRLGEGLGTDPLAGWPATHAAALVGDRPTRPERVRARGRRPAQRVRGRRRTTSPGCQALHGIRGRGAAHRPPQAQKDPSADVHSS